MSLISSASQFVLFKKWVRAVLILNCCMGTITGRQHGVKEAKFGNMWSLFLSFFHLCVSPCLSDVWAAWAPNGSVTGTRRTTDVSPVKMIQSTTCWRWEILFPIYQADRCLEEIMILIFCLSKPQTYSRLCCSKKKSSATIWVQTGEARAVMWWFTMK